MADPKTPNLGLHLTTDDTITFKSWREKLNGDGEGETKSNMQLIDEAIGNINLILDELNGEEI